jgi:hypothetical protein
MKNMIVAIAVATALATLCAFAADDAPPRGKPIAPAAARQSVGEQKNTNKPAVLGKQDKPDREKELARNIGNFVQQMKDKGLRGRQLADAIHKYLRELGIEAAHGNAGGDKPRREDNAHTDNGVGGFVQELLDQGLRGEALAAAIHAELLKRGIGKGHGNPGGDENARGKTLENKAPARPVKPTAPPQGGPGEKSGAPPFVPPGHRR